MFRQKMYDILLDWKSRFQGRTAMLVEGVRRVGKSTVVEEFTRREYRSYILVDSPRHPATSTNCSMMCPTSTTCSSNSS